MSLYTQNTILTIQKCEKIPKYKIKLQLSRFSHPAFSLIWSTIETIFLTSFLFSKISMIPRLCVLLKVFLPVASFLPIGVCWNNIFYDCLFWKSYFPIQNLLKILSNKSSVVMVPVISPKWKSPARISMARKSPVTLFSSPWRTSDSER